MSKIRQAREILAANFPESKVIFNLENYLFYILNRTAVKIWGFLEKPKEVKEIIIFLKENYNLSTQRASRDVKKFIHQLKKRGLIEYVNQRD